MKHVAEAGGQGLPARHRAACLIIGRNLGDAVIQSLFFRGLVERGFAERYYVWTRPQVAFLFQGIPNCEVVTSPFPVGTAKQFDRAGFKRFMQAVGTLRAAGPLVTIDLIGDFRERLFAKLIGSRRHLHIGWSADHPFAKIIRNPFGPGRPVCSVPASVANVYEAHGIMLSALTAGSAATPCAPVSAPSMPPRPRRVGLHPFASQDCKLWPDEQWRELAHRLQDQDISITAYGAPSDRPALERIFGGLPQPVAFFTRSIPDFSADVATLDLMIGLDSFSVHMAEREGVRSIMLNACNHPTLWTPPHGQSLSNSGGCKAHPCMNVPSCQGGPEEYICIRTTKTDLVAKLVVQS